VSIFSAAVSSPPHLPRRTRLRISSSARFSIGKAARGYPPNRTLTGRRSCRWQPWLRAKNTGGRVWSLDNAGRSLRWTPSSRPSHALPGMWKRFAQHSQRNGWRPKMANTPSNHRRRERRTSPLPHHGHSRGCGDALPVRGVRPAGARPRCGESFLVGSCIKAMVRADARCVPAAAFEGERPRPYGGGGPTAGNWSVP
jgi:hypothetical protein